MEIGTKVYAKPVRGMAAKFITEVNGKQVIAKTGDYDVIESQGIRIRDYKGSDEPQVFVIKRFRKTVYGSMAADIIAEDKGIERFLELSELIEVN